MMFKNNCSTCASNSEILSLLEMAAISEKISKHEMLVRALRSYFEQSSENFE